MFANKRIGLTRCAHTRINTVLNGFMTPLLLWLCISTSTFPFSLYVCYRFLCTLYLFFCKVLEKIYRLSIWTGLAFILFFSYNLIFSHDQFAFCLSLLPPDEAMMGEVEWGGGSGSGGGGDGELQSNSPRWGWCCGEHQRVSSLPWIDLNELLLLFSGRLHAQSFRSL